MGFLGASVFSQMHNFTFVGANMSYNPYKEFLSG